MKCLVLTRLTHPTRALSKSLEPLHSPAGRVRVILNDVKDPPYNSEAPWILRLPPQDGTCARDFDMALPVRHTYELALV